MSLQIFILGVLYSGNHHPYDIKKMFKKDNLEDIHTITDGTLYYNFDVLLKKECIEKISVTRDVNRPEKTTYGITDKGRETLQQGIYNSFKQLKDIPSLYSPTIFLKYVDKNKVAFLIEEGIEKFQGQLERNLLEWEVIQHEAPQSAHLIQEHVLNQKRLELDWLKKLLAYVQTL
ncbi:PadR family transcriptional regulator [Paenibacillus pini]|uniref:Transcription regulator PadR N-terminal domain-containing protein n=1 Tax=Paenibacillus pini JCM 16418 TaxID=1236976 RepID=W7YIZ1_9BACL|nr:PadR family transcriptional regulator [Paenibacillus pini]GAF08437.1 hypothetical protein JCM16418_2511 [Paenibacillus pini JCM 16418]